MFHMASVATLTSALLKQCKDFPFKLELHELWSSLSHRTATSFFVSLETEVGQCLVRGHCAHKHCYEVSKLACGTLKWGVICTLLSSAPPSRPRVRCKAGLSNLNELWSSWRRRLCGHVQVVQMFLVFNFKYRRTRQNVNTFTNWSLSLDYQINTLVLCSTDYTTHEATCLIVPSKSMHSTTNKNSLQRSNLTIVRHVSGPRATRLRPLV